MINASNLLKPIKVEPIELSTIYIPENIHFIRHFLNNKYQRSSCTGKSYEIDIKEFFNVPMIEDISLDMIRQVSILDVENFINYLSKKGRASTTIHRKVSSLSSLYAWLLKYQDNSSGISIIKYNPFSNMKDTKPRVSFHETEFLTKEESKKLVEDLKTDTILELRNKTIICLALNTAIRKSEIINIKLKDITKILDFDVIKVVRKGNKKDVIKINSYVKNLINEYIRRTDRNYEDNANTYLFLAHGRNQSTDNEKLDPTTLNKMLNKYSKIYGIGKHLKVHSLRHTAITIAIQNGVTLEKVQSFAAHESANTTARYIHSVNKLTDNAADKIDIF